MKEKLHKVEKFLYYRRTFYSKKIRATENDIIMIDIMIEICTMGAEICKLLRGQE